MYQDPLKKVSNSQHQLEEELTKFVVLEIGNMELVTNLSYEKFLKTQPTLEVTSQNFDGGNTKTLELYKAFYKKSESNLKWFILISIVLVLLAAALVCKKKKVQNSKRREF